MKYTWHECVNYKTMMKVPTEIHGNVPTEINFWEIIIVIEWVMTFLEKITIFFEYFMDIPTLKPVKWLKLSSINRYDLKIDFRD